MPKNRIRLIIASPPGLVFDGEADYVTFRCIDGDMGVKPGHLDCAVVLGSGALRIFRGKEQTDIFSVLGGYAVVRQNTVYVLSEFAEHPDDIDRAKAEQQRNRMRLLLKEKDSDVDINHAQKALRQALVRLDVSSYSVGRHLHK